MIAVTVCDPLRDFEPDQASDAAQRDALLDDQLSVDEPPAFTVAGFALMETVGGGTTVTVTLRVVLPDEPAHSSVKVVVVTSGTVTSEPARGFSPTHPPRALQVVAPDEVQVSVDCPLIGIEPGERDKLTEGAAQLTCANANAARLTR